MVMQEDYMMRVGGCVDTDAKGYLMGVFWVEWSRRV